MPMLALTVFVMLNGQPIEFKDASPFMKNGRVMVPLRSISEAMGAQVEYASTTREINIQRGGHGITFGDKITSGKKPATPSNTSKNDSWEAADTAENLDRFMSPLEQPVRKNGRIFVPLRFFAQELGARVRWDGAKRTAYITQASDEKPSTPGIRAGEIEVKIATDKASYRAGETVRFTITAQNQDDRPRTLEFRSGQSFDITVTPAGKDAPLWQWSHDRMFTMALREQTVQPGETLSFEATWDQKDNDGNPAPRGEYSATAVLTVTGDPLLSPPITIRLGE